MIDHYNAFISYKHAPEDNRVAEAVHKGLERYHIPGRIRKKKGIKRINRIFRDKDELPITNDLSDTIQQALANSDYLIVICSTNTKESAWVPREIEYFLQNHSKKDIFTVLVNGEPYDVIPQILLYEEQVVMDENGGKQTVRIPIEPLSCDYRMPLKKAKKTELPRLASGLIGCAYDELMNRHRQYRIKQLTAVFSVTLAVMLGFCGYMYYSRDKIHKNYLESLKNQSRYLANESGSLLEKEQRIPALQLALEALPKDDTDDRPVTAEAVKALTDATLAYEGRNGSNIHAAWNYQMPNIIADFQVSHDGKYIAILDNGSVTGVWDTGTHERLLYLEDLDADAVGIRFATDHSLLVWTDHELFCYDVTNAKKLWEYALEEDLFEDKDNLMLTDNSVYFITTKSRLLEFDTASGKVKKELALPEESGYEGFSIVESRLSPDGTKIAFRGLGGWNTYAYGIWEIGSDKIVLSEYFDGLIKDIEWADNDTLMVASTPIDMKGSMSYGSSDLISSDHVTVQCLGAKDLFEKWKTDFICNGVALGSGFVGLGQNSVAYYSGNVVSVYDLATGNNQYSNNVNDPVLDVSDKDGDGNPTYITESGGLATPALSVDTDAVYYNRYFTDELRQVVISNGVYVRQHLGSEVIYYGVQEYDKEWTQIGNETDLSGDLKDFCLSDACLAVVSEEEEGPVLTTFGMDEKSVVAHSRLEGEKAYKYKILGVCRDRVYLGYDNEDEYEIYSADLAGGAVKKEKGFTMISVFDNACVMKADRLFYTCRDQDQKNVLVMYDTVTGESTQTELPEDIGLISHVPVYYEDENVVYVQGESGYILDPESGKAVKADVSDEWAGASCFSDNTSDGRYAVSDTKRILIADKKGRVTGTIRCPGVAPEGMTFNGSHLLVLYHDGSLYWYERESGQFTKKTDVSIYYGFNGEADFEQDMGQQLLYIRMDRLTDVIDLESGVEIAHITDCFGHHRGRDIFVTSSGEADEGTGIGYYKRYTVEELIEKAHTILQNAELTEEMKSRYGIR